MHPDLDFIYTRRSIRKFKPDAVPSELLEELLRAAMAAPSASNSQPWEFIIITRQQTIASLRRALPFGHYDATAAIAVLGSPLKARNPAGLLYWEQDCSAAVQNILLAANALGLGAVWIGCHPVKPEVWGVRRALKIPRTSTPLAVIMLGYPAEEKPARTRYDPLKVHWEAYGGGASTPAER
ncbi:MAG: nitroreductase family protein [Anaerolineae bacterium]|nr:nitroreductase family protein [Anaerolineae bacterium]